MNIRGGIMGVALWFGIPVAVAILLALLSKCMDVASGFSIAGAVVALLGTLVLSGIHWPRLRTLLNWMSPRFGAIEKGLALLLDDSKKKRELGEGDSGFQEILKVIAARRPGIEPAKISAILCGSMGGENGGEGTIAHERILLRPKGRSPLDPPDLLATRDTFEQWIRDARVRSLSCLGFGIVAFGVSLGLVSLVVQAIGSRS